MLYHLSLVQNNRVKLVKLGAVSTLLSMMRGGERHALAVQLSCVQRGEVGDANAVEILVGMLTRQGSESESESTRENCVAALDSLSHGRLRFKGAGEGGGVEGGGGERE